MFQGSPECCGNDGAAGIALETPNTNSTVDGFKVLDGWEHVASFQSLAPFGHWPSYYGSGTRSASSTRIGIVFVRKGIPFCVSALHGWGTVSAMG